MYDDEEVGRRRRTPREKKQRDEQRARNRKKRKTRKIARTKWREERREVKNLFSNLTELDKDSAVDYIEEYYSELNED